MDRKEEIVKQLCDGWVGGMSPGDEQRIVYPAMDLYAEEMSIKFAKFVTGTINPIYVNFGNGQWEILKPSKQPYTREFISDKELFQLFLQSKNNQQ